jgi:hypothetical protein
MSASATVSQPFSSARLSASASEAIPPVAKMAPAGAWAAPAQGLGGNGEGAGKKDCRAREGDRAVEAGDAIIERDQNGEGREHRRRAPQDGDEGLARAVLGKEAGSAEEQGKARAEHERRAEEITLGPPQAVGHDTFRQAKLA